MTTRLKSMSKIKPLSCYINVQVSKYFQWLYTTKYNR